MDVRKLAHDVQDFVVAFRRDLHEHPEPSMQEFRTTDRVCEELDKLGVTYKRLDPTGLIAEVHGEKPGKIVALRADMDALSIQEQTDYPFKSKNDGFMHACGHDSHTAMLLGAVKVLQSIKGQFSGTVRFIFQPAEEIGKGAMVAINAGCMEGVSKIFGMHIGTQQPVGEITAVKGPGYAAADIFKIVIKGSVTHGAAPHAGVDATVCAAAVVMNLQTMVSREFSPAEPVVVTVGSLHSGSRFNIISGEAVMEGTIRNFNRDIHSRVEGIVRRIVEGTCTAMRCTAEVEYNTLTNVLVNDPDAVDAGLAAARKIQSPELVKYGTPTMGGEDFADYTTYCPAAFFGLGVGGEHPLHSDFLYIDESAFEVGVALHVQCALDALAE